MGSQDTQPIRIIPAKQWTAWGLPNEELLMRRNLFQEWGREGGNNCHAYETMDHLWTVFPYLALSKRRSVSLSFWNVSIRFGAGSSFSVSPGRFIKFRLNDRASRRLRIAGAVESSAAGRRSNGVEP